MTRIASYNIRKAVGLDWRRDGERILRVLEEIDADVIVLQEADKRIGQREGVLPVDLLEQDLGYIFADLSTRPLSHGWHGNAVLYRKTKMPAPDIERIELPSLEPRGAVAAQFSQPCIQVVGVHLALNKTVRIKQLGAIGHAFATVKTPILIAGDFNDWNPKHDIAGVLGGGFEMVKPGNSFHAARPMAALDQFALRGQVQHMNSHVHHSKLAARASDHLPIMIDLELSEGIA